MARPKSNKPKKTKVVYTRITEKEYKEMLDLCEIHRIETESQFMRNAVFYYKECLKSKQKKTK